MMEDTLRAYVENLERRNNVRYLHLLRFPTRLSKRLVAGVLHAAGEDAVLNFIFICERQVCVLRIQLRAALADPP